MNAEGPDDGGFYSGLTTDASGAPVMFTRRTPAAQLRWLADALDNGTKPETVAISLHLLAGELGVPWTEESPRDVHQEAAPLWWEEN